MELKKIKALADLLREKDLTSITLREGDDELELTRMMDCCQPPMGVPVVPSMAPIAPAAAPVVPAPAQQSGTPAVPTGPVITSPMVGVVYLAPAPDAEAFVSVGKAVKPGDTVCIVEAMKLMNEITAEQAGTIAEICVENGQVVEFGQPLFRLG